MENEAQNATIASIPLATAFTANPQEAYRMSIEIYLSVGALSVFMWDFIYNLGEDYSLVKMPGNRKPLVIYFISRFSTLICVLLGVITLTLPSQHCKGFQVAAGISYNLFISTTMLLSYFRVVVVWNRNRIITAVYGFLWVAAVAGSLTVITGAEVTHLAGSPFCTKTVVGTYVSASVILPTLNHVAIYVAISERLCRPRHEEERKMGGLRQNYRVFVLGESLPAFSKTMLHTSQLCYLVAAIVGIASTIWFYVFRSDPTYRLAILCPYSVTVNIMFSWVFRKAKLGGTAATLPTNNDINIHMHGGPATIVIKQEETFDELTTKSDCGDSQWSDNTGVQVEEVVDSKTDFQCSDAGSVHGNMEVISFV